MLLRALDFGGVDTVRGREERLECRLARGQDRVFGRGFQRLEQVDFKLAQGDLAVTYAMLDSAA
jgi:hypothetical protein